MSINQVYLASNGKKVRLNKNNYLASGGEAAIYHHQNFAIKVYHDSKKMIPLNKIAELKNVTDDNIIKPLEVVYDNNKLPVGYVMKLILNSNPLCKLFTKAFKLKNNISITDIIDFIKIMQSTVTNIHSNKCVIGDFNEMNILAGDKNKIPYFIDIDSWQTPSYKATAYNDSVRDRTVPLGTFNELTDWYAFAILAFQLYIGIHPYKGKHPDYKMNEWILRMEKGISAFDKKVTLPKVCNNLNVIPKPHLEWMKNIFIKNERSIPPLVDQISIPLVTKQIVIIKGNDKFQITDIYSSSNNIRLVYDIMGSFIINSGNEVYKDSKLLTTISESYDKIEICRTNNMQPIIALKRNNKISFYNNNNLITTVMGNYMMMKDDHIYTIFQGNLYKNEFTIFGNKIIHKLNQVSLVPNNVIMYDGIAYSDILGKQWIFLPINNSCYNMHIPELDGYRILSMKSSKNICIILAEKNNVYTRFILIFNSDFRNYTVRKVDDIVYDNINMVVLDNGICIMVANDTTIEVFKDNTKVKTIDNAPFDSSMPLYNSGNKVYFINEKTLYQVTMR